MSAVWRTLQHYVLWPARRWRRGPEARSLCRNPRFASFLAQNNRRALDTDFHDAVLRGRRWVRRALVALLAAAGAWIALESARALTVF
ncbi:MAG: hypothetical protein NT173_09380 [Opitutales bacterium]|nr:hypothetical protein [Opitutales bacterium]